MTVAVLLSIQSLSTTGEVTVRAYHESCFRCATYSLDGYDAGRFIGIMVRPQTHLRITDYDGLATRNYYDTLFSKHLRQ